MHGPFLPEKDAPADIEDGEIKTLHADSVVFSAGVMPCVDECYEYAAAAKEFYIIGDANVHTNDMWMRFMLPDKAPKVGGDVLHATATAYAAAMNL